MRQHDALDIVLILSIRFCIPIFNTDILIIFIYIFSFGGVQMLIFEMRCLGPFVPFVFMCVLMTSKIVTNLILHANACGNATTVISNDPRTMVEGHMLWSSDSCWNTRPHSSCDRRIETVGMQYSSTCYHSELIPDSELAIISSTICVFYSQININIDYFHSNYYILLSHAKQATDSKDAKGDQMYFL